MNPRIEPLLNLLEDGANTLAKRTAELRTRLDAHAAAEAEAEERRTLIIARWRARHPSEPPRGRR